MDYRPQTKTNKEESGWRHLETDALPRRIMVGYVDIVKVEKVNLVDEVYRQILQQIVSGNWPEGEKIASEHQLMKSFAVSRVVIREALQRLRSEKYIITKQGVGSFVTNPNNYDNPEVEIDLSEGMYEQLMQFRQAIEFASVGLSVAYATEEDYKRLFHCVERMESAQDLETFSRADCDFHCAVIYCAHNELFNQAMSANQKMMFRILKEMNRVPKSQGFAIDTHRKIAEAISQKNVNRALEEYGRNIDYNMVRLADFYGKKKQD